MPGIVDPTKEVLNKRIVYPRAKIIGGCSTVNGMIYMQVFFFSCIFKLFKFGS